MSATDASAFAGFFIRDQWGWRLRNWSWSESPITMWVVAGGRWQVNFNRWPAKTVFAEAQAREVAMALYNQHVRETSQD